jgi:hypothetical protein
MADLNDFNKPTIADSRVDVQDTNRAHHARAISLNPGTATNRPAGAKLAELISNVFTLKHWNGSAYDTWLSVSGFWRGLLSGASASDARVALGQPASMQNNEYTAYLSTGTSSAYQVTASPAITTYLPNVQVLLVTFHAPNAAGATMSWNGLPPLLLTEEKADGSVVALSADRIEANRAYFCLVILGYIKVLDLPNAVDLKSVPQGAAVGEGALALNTTGINNVAVGHNTLGANTTGGGNTAVGSGALQSNTTAGANTAVGSSSLASNTSGADNTALGNQTLQSNTTGVSNTAVGRYALVSNTIGSNNMAAGNEALASNTSGANNTALGYGTLQSNTTGYNNTAVGINALVSGATYNNATGLGASATVTGSNQVQLGDSSTTTYAYGAVQNRSDERDKKDIAPTLLGLNFVLKLSPIRYKYAYRKEFLSPKDTGTAGTRFHEGFSAQHVKTVLDDLGLDFGGYQDHSIAGGADVLSLGYTEFIGPIVKAVQELHELLEDQQRTIDQLKARIQQN